jgi:hypothetical protein
MNTTPYQNISITGNFIADPGGPAVWVGNTAGATVTNNYFLTPNNGLQQNAYPPFLAQLAEPLVAWSSANVTTASNTIDQTSGRVLVTDTSFNELAAYAPGSVYKLTAYNLGTLVSPTITLTDGDGNVWPVTIATTSTHALDVQIPTSVGLGGAYFTLTAGSTKYFGTLFLDSQDNIPALNGCTYETSLSSTTIPAGAGSLPILVVTQAGCSYQVLATDSFVTPPPSAMGTAVISVGFGANTGAARTTVIEIAGQQIAVTQAAPTTPVVTAVVNGADFKAEALSPRRLDQHSGTESRSERDCLCSEHLRARRRQRFNLRLASSALL